MSTTVTRALNPRTGCFENVEHSEKHESLLHAFHTAWHELERVGYPIHLLRCHIASLRLAVSTLTVIEHELKVLLHRAEEKLAEMESLRESVEEWNRL